MNDFSNELNVETATLAELENMTFADMLGGDVSDYDVRSTLPDCTVGVVIEKSEEKKEAADIDEDKKAHYYKVVQFKIVHVFSCADPNIDPQTLVGRMHIERFDLLNEFGKSKLVGLILGAYGVNFSKKDEWAQLGASFNELFDQLESESIQFGISLATKVNKKTGSEFTNIEIKQKSFVPMDEYAEVVGG